MTPGLFQVCERWLADSTADSEGERSPSPVFAPLPEGAPDEVRALRDTALALWGAWGTIGAQAHAAPDNQTLADATALAACAYKALAAQLREMRGRIVSPSAAAGDVFPDPLPALVPDFAREGDVCER